ncbi:hypothetical protein LV164_003935 [Aspergillus fumigatus]|nr:hypothetical protein KXX42_004459 [Aspergillus fumigatus]KAH3016556.1 hypothetical protein KXW60_007428 [Aspergillus fumigatus]KAH3144446.1 hypothetical protein KXW18_008454 [Aspergillus fumigatus]KAH3193191.1 hypothetical protein KXV92_002035 [Aspergillus fumigatus]KAH3275380.1 hypothetical protein KXW55_007008 [Aspergillus fumigatus]
MPARRGPYSGQVSRRSHRKSRLGCRNCKRRRVKCDEVKPNCGNCLRHSIECDYTLNTEGTSTPSREEETRTPTSLNDNYTFISSSQSNFTPPRRGRSSRPLPTQEDIEPKPQLHLPVAKKLFQFTATDMALFHHFITSADLGGSQKHMQTQLSQLGFTFHYVLRLLLAFSAFHLARHSTNDSLLGSRTELYALAEQHYEIAVREVTEAIPHLDTTTSPGLYASSIFIFLCSLAKGPQPGEYLAYRDDGGPGCLSLFMGLRSILEICTATLSVDFSSIHTKDSADMAPQPEEPPFRSQALTSQAYGDHLDKVRHLISRTFPVGGPGYRDYCQVLDRLGHCYDVVFGDSHLPESQLWPQIFGWLYTQPDLFLSDAARRRPAALVVFAFFTILLKRLDAAWFIRGWPEHIINSIYSNLDEHHRQYVQWPMQQIAPQQLMFAKGDVP